MRSVTSEPLPVKRTEKKYKFFYTARQVCRAVGTEDLGILLRQDTQIFGCLGGKIKFMLFHRREDSKISLHPAGVVVTDVALNHLD